VDIWQILADIVILLGGAVLVGGIFARMGQSPLVGYLIAGMFLGGGGSLGIIDTSKEIDVVAELGVALLLFSLGLEFSPARLRQVGFKVLLAGVFQIVATLLLCAGGASLVGAPTTTAVAIGAMVALSSTAVVLRTLTDSGELDSTYGRNTLAVLLVQDLAVVPLAMLVSVMAGDSESVGLNILTLLGLGLGLMVALYIILNVVARYLLGLLTLQHNRELAVLLAVVVGLGSAWAAHAIKLSPALGAFLAGMFLGSSPFAHQLRADVSSFRIVLLTIFFGAAGMVADPVWMVTHLGPLLATTFAVFAVKGLVVFGLFRLSGQPTAASATTAICLAQVGEFSFVLGAVALTSDVLPKETHQLIVSVTILSLLVTPLMLRHASQIGIWIARWTGRSDSAIGDSQTKSRYDVVVFGFGPAGRETVAALQSDSRSIAVIDLNRQNIETARAMGLSAYLGDGTQPDVLEHISLATAPLVFVTIPDKRASVLIVSQVRSESAAAHIIARARSDRDMKALEQAGANTVISDEHSAALAFRNAVKDLSA